MFGNNKILKPLNHSGDFLEVQEIFPTLQGEGSFVGQPAVFLRLGGCNLACKFCDTEFDNFTKIALEEVVQNIVELAQNNVKQRVRNLVVITGGEPLRQPIEKLCKKLRALKFIVQIETNGTIYRKLPKSVKIICSPKVTNGKYHQIRADLLPYISAFKFIISAHLPAYNQVPAIIENQRATAKQIPIFVQPMDEYDAVKNRINLELAVKLCEERGYFLSLQTHKIVGLK